MKKRSISEPNYLKKLRYLHRIGAIPREVGVHQVSIFHDDWCGIWQQRRCNCEPDIRLQWSQPAAVNN